MKVLFLKDIPGVARKNDVKEVKEGYGRNYLIPRGYAARATDDELGRLREAESAREQRAAVDKVRYEELAKECSSLTLSFKVKAPAKGKSFGSVSVADIHAELAKKKPGFKKEWIALAKPIKTVGEEQHVPLSFPFGISGSVRVVITAET